MSDWSLISEGGDGEGVVASTKSGDGFTMLNQRPTRINSRNAVASWVGTQVAASFPSDSTLNSANSSLGIAKVNNEASALPNRTQTVKIPISISRNLQNRDFLRLAFTLPFYQNHKNATLTHSFA